MRDSDHRRERGVVRDRESIRRTLPSSFWSLSLSINSQAYYFIDYLPAFNYNYNNSILYLDNHQNVRPSSSELPPSHSSSQVLLPLSRTRNISFIPSKARRPLPRSSFSRATIINRVFRLQQLFSLWLPHSQAWTRSLGRARWWEQAWLPWCYPSLSQIWTSKTGLFGSEAMISIYSGFKLQFYLSWPTTTTTIFNVTKKKQDTIEWGKRQKNATE